MKKHLLTLFLLAITGFALAQPGGGPPPDPGQPVPISGIEILIGAGLLYGIKNSLDRKRKNTD
jgi:hypothetical protein